MVTSSKENENEKNLTLPTELITEIMLRLPVRSLLRFKCVCRSWFFLISDPQFAQSHFDLNATAPTHRLLLPCLDKDKIESFDLDSSSLADRSAVVTLNLPLSGMLCNSIGSCRGFIMVLDLKGIIVLNPCTGFRKQIPQFMLASLYGFGYDNSTDDYLAVRIRLGCELNAAEIDTFRMKTSSWDHTKCVNVQYMDLGSEHRNGMFLNGSLHWLVISHDTRLRLVISFDLLEKSLSEIPLPHELAAAPVYRRPDLYHVRVLGGCLSLCYTGSKRDKAEIWVMKEYKVQSSWTKAFVITSCDIPCKHFHPIHFIEGGGVVGTDGRLRLMKFNAEGKLLEHKKYPEEYKYVQKYFAMYRESLLSFPGEQPLLRDFKGSN